MKGSDSRANWCSNLPVRGRIIVQKSSRDWKMARQYLLKSKAAASARFLLKSLYDELQQQNTSVLLLNIFFHLLGKVLYGKLGHWALMWV
jgi:hypothetical protein